MLRFGAASGRARLSCPALRRIDSSCDWEDRSMEETTTTHKPHRFGRAVVPLGLLGGIAASYPLVIRPWHRRWGATAEEVAAPMPGDDIVADANYHTTRAI